MPTITSNHPKTRYNVCNGVRVKWRKLSALQIKIAGVISYRNNARAGSSNVIELTGTLPSFFAGLKTATLIYQCFYFTKTAKNAIFGRNGKIKTLIYQCFYFYFYKKRWQSLFEFDYR